MVSIEEHMLQVEERIPRVQRHQWTDAMRDVFAVFGGEEARINGSKANVINVMAHHPTLVLPWLEYNKVLLENPLIDEKLREIIILRVAWLHRSEYEYVQHVAIGRRAGLTDAQLAAIQDGTAASVWSETERLALAATDDMTKDSCISAGTWAGLSAKFNHAEMLELMFVVGTYTMLAMMFNSVGLSLKGDGLAAT